MINRAGVKLQPDEIEEVLARHPGVRDVCVFGVPDPVMGETAAGLLVARINTEAEADPPRACLSFTVPPARRAAHRVAPGRSHMLLVSWPM